jgi:hypothetical protein
MHIMNLQLNLRIDACVYISTNIEGKHVTGALQSADKSTVPPDLTIPYHEQAMYCPSPPAHITKERL